VKAKARGKILVVDDDEQDRELARRALADEGYEVVTASDGREAVQKAKTERPDLVLLDVMMPEQDGWDTCDMLRAAEETRSTLIVFLTRVDPPRTLYTDHAAFDTDWNDYVTKPLTPRKLVDVVQRLLEKPSPGAVPLKLSGK
jgi:two-component system alkaline phosphatase synthesis response regulator PhoP